MPLTPLQQGLLFHAGTAQGNGDDVYAVQLDITITGPLEPQRLRDAVHTVVGRHPNLVARFCDQFDEPVQVIEADPVVPWRYVDLSAGDAGCRGAGPAGVCCRARRGVRSGRAVGVSGGVDPHRGQIGTGLC